MFLNKGLAVQVWYALLFESIR